MTAVLESYVGVEIVLLPFATQPHDVTKSMFAIISNTYQSGVPFFVALLLIVRVNADASNWFFFTMCP